MSRSADAALTRLLTAWQDYRSAAHAVREAAGYRPQDRVMPGHAVAQALAAHAVAGVADPTGESPFNCSVIGASGERILVWAADGASLGFEGGLVARFDEDKWDRVALVALYDMNPLAVHIMDAECYHRVARELAPKLGRTTIPAGKGFLCLNFMLHCNITLEPLLADMLGVQTTWLNADAGQRPPSGTAATRVEGSVMRSESSLLAQRVRTLRESRQFEYVPLGVPYHNMAATLADGFLQAGLNYLTCVEPRIRTIRSEYSDVVTTSDFIRLLDRRDEFWRAIRWNGQIKRQRIETAARYLENAGVQNEEQLLAHLRSEPDAFADLPGVGPKTLDYFRMLCGDSSRVAVDVHIRDFLKQSGVSAAGTMPYEIAQTIVIEAAGELEVDPALLDHSIWTYMASADSSHTGCEE